MPPREILLEMTTIGNALRVVAIDAETGTEVTFQAPATTSRPTLERLAADKLRYVMGKRRG